MNEEKDKWTEIIRSKLYDFEIDTRPKDWNRIVARLDGSRKHGRYHIYRAVAAAILIIAGGLGWYYGVNRHADSDKDTFITNAPTPYDISTDTNRRECEPTQSVITDTLSVIAERLQPTVAIVRKRTDKSNKHTQTFADDRKLSYITTDDCLADVLRSFSLRSYEMDIPKPRVAALGTKTLSTVKRRRWGFGAGGGGYATASNSNYVVLNNTVMHHDDFMTSPQMIELRRDLQAPPSNNQQNVANRHPDKPMGAVKHKTPLSLGLGVSYYLNDRWTLQSGLTYTLLQSEWTYQPVELDKRYWKQQLHFIGIPLSASYTIVEWKRFHIYAAAGGMCEWNISGRRKRTTTIANLSTDETNRIRMKAPLWSLNARAGVSYPLWRFIYLYGEAGASYYFDNHSDIETIRSYKPFNLSLQGGIRFSF